jgi:superfamily II DNA/RNA helicase
MIYFYRPQACTGSGKTLAFVIPAVEMILRREQPLKPHAVGALIISPTRELARQTFAVCAHFAACSEGALAPPLLITGGNSVAADVKKVSTATALPMVVATPGRLDDLLARYELFELRDLELLVLDEADTLLDMGFRTAITNILGRLPKQRRTGLFSATQTRWDEEQPSTTTTRTSPLAHTHTHACNCANCHCSDFLCFCVLGFSRLVVHACPNLFCLFSLVQQRGQRAC